MSTENPILDATDVSVIVDRKDKPGQKARTEWRVPVVTTGGTPGAIPLTTDTGMLDPSLIPGSSGSSPIVTTMTAGQTINAFQMVSVHSDGLAYLADVTNLADASQTIGMAITSATTGLPVQVQEVGFMLNAGWSWATPGKTLYLGAAGALTTTVPTTPGSVFELPVGTTISSTKVELQLGLPVILA